MPLHPRSAASRSSAIGGIPVRWEEAGEGMPVVLLHGLPTSPALWRFVVPRLMGAGAPSGAPDVRPLAWELVGYGDSAEAGRVAVAREGPPAIGLTRQAEYLVAWLDALGLERVVLVGHDVGGGVAQIIATRHPERCAGLVLTNSVCYDAWPVPAVKVLRALGPVVRRTPGPLLEAGVFGPLMARGHDDARVAAESLPVHGAPYAAHDPGAMLVRQMRALDARDTETVVPLLPGLRERGVPARVVWGAADGFLPVHLGERLARDMGAPLTRIAGGKHFTPEDHPHAIAAAVREVVHAVAHGAGR